MEKLNRINGGIYLVLNPGMETGLLLARLADALAGGLLEQLAIRSSAFRYY